MPVSHSVPSVGYQVISKDGKSLFYTGDTGPGLATCWESVSPDVLLIEVSGPNAFNNYLGSMRHLTPASLKEELHQFSRIKGYLPHVVVVHIPPQYHSAVEAEVAEVGKELGVDIMVGREDMVINI